MPQIAVSQFAADLAAVIADLPAGATAAFINGTCSVTLSELSVENMLVLAGNIDVRHYEIIMSLSDTSRPPAVTDRVAITGQGEISPTNYEVVTWNKSPDAVAYRIIVKADHRN